MPYYRGRRWRRRPRRYVRRWFRRRIRRFVNGSSRSISRIKTSFTMTKDISAGYQTTPGAVYFSSPFNNLGSEGSLAHSLLYRQYCNLYEEVKIIGVKVALAVVTPVGDTTTPSLQLYTAWDRKRGYNEGAPTANDIISSSTYNVATALNNNVAKLTRSCYASDLMEKAMFLDSGLAADTFYNKAWRAAEQNPTFFCPSFMVTAISPSLGAAHDITISVSYTYYLAFRNPKYGGGDATASVQDLGTRSVSFPDDDDGNMDDAGDVDEPNQPQIDAALAAAAVGGSTVKSQPKSAALMEASHRKKHAANKAIVLDPPSKNA